MGRQFKNQTHFNCFFVTTTFIRHRPYGNVAGMYEALAESLGFCLAKYSAHLAAYCFMPTHLHVLLFIQGRCLGGFMRDFKKYIAQKAAQDLRLPAGKVWEDRYDRLAIESEAILRVKVTYIHNNPVKAGLTTGAVDWKWSSALDYETERSGILSICKDWMG